MGATHGMNNQGIMHAVFEYGKKPLCGSRRALMATVIEKFRDEQRPCKRCASKLAEMDARAAKKAEAMNTDTTKTFRYPYYTTSQLARAATAAKISTKERIAMLDEITRREAEEAAKANDASS